VSILFVILSLILWKKLGKIQRKAAIWILGAFKTFLLSGIKAITVLIPINLHLKKLSRKSQLWAYSLLSNHILYSLIEPRDNLSYHQHLLSLGKLTRHQCHLIKGSAIDIDNWFNKVYPSFNSFHSELSLGNRVIDIFSYCFYFYPFSECKSNIKEQIQKLNNLAIES